MRTVKEIESQLNEVLLQAEKQRLIEANDAIVQIKNLIQTFDIRFTDIYPDHKEQKPSAKTASTNKAPAKYRNPMTGATWSGRGLAPLWIKDKNRDDFLI